MTKILKFFLIIFALNCSTSGKNILGSFKSPSEKLSLLSINVTRGTSESPKKNSIFFTLNDILETYKVVESDTILIFTRKLLENEVKKREKIVKQLRKWSAKYLPRQASPYQPASYEKISFNYMTNEGLKNTYLRLNLDKNLYPKGYESFISLVFSFVKG